MIFDGPTGIRCDSYLYRQIEPLREASFARAFRRNLLAPLIEDGLVIDTQPAAHTPAGVPTALRQRALPFTTFPHEWCPPMLCQAARVLLDVSLRLARHGYALKNIRPTTVQFDVTRPLVVDVSSLAPLSGEPTWVGYPEFAAEFLYPLALMAYGQEPVARYLLARGGLRTADMLAHLKRSRFPASLRAELKANSTIRRLLRVAWHVVHPISPQPKKRPPGTRSRDAVVRHIELAREELEEIAPLVTAPRFVPRMQLPRPRVRRLIEGLAPVSTIDLAGTGAMNGPGGATALAFHAKSDACAADYFAASRRDPAERHLPLMVDPANLPAARGPAPYDRLRADVVFAVAAETNLLRSAPSEVRSAVAAAACWSRRWLLIELPPGCNQPPAPLLHELEQRFHSITRLPSDLAAGGLVLCER